MIEIKSVTKKYGDFTEDETVDYSYIKKDEILISSNLYSISPALLFNPSITRTNFSITKSPVYYLYF